MNTPDEFDRCQTVRPKKRKRRRVKRRTDWRPLMWWVTPAAALMSVIGVSWTATESFSFRYEQDWINASLASRMTYGEGATVVDRAMVDLSYGDFRYSVRGRGARVAFPADVVGQPHYKAGAIKVRYPETTIGPMARFEQGMSDDWAEVAPEALSLVSGIIRTVTSPADVWSEQSTRNKTRLLANSLPVIKLPDADDARIVAGSVDSIMVERGAVIVKGSDWSLTGSAMVWLCVLALSLFGLAALWLNRGFGRP